MTTFPRISKFQVIPVLLNLVENGSTEKITICEKLEDGQREASPSKALADFKDACSIKRYYMYVDNDGHLTLSDFELGGMWGDE